MENKNVRVRSLSNGQLTISFPELNFKRTFEKKGSVKLIPYNILVEGLWEPGFSYMIHNGLVEILDKDVCKELGLVITNSIEEFEKNKEDETVESVVFVLDDKQKKRYLTVAPISELKEVLNKLNPDQRTEFAQFAIDHEYVDYERDKIIKQFTGIDIPHSVNLKHQLED